jgi:hypothetical protein
MILLDLLATPQFYMSIPCVALMSELFYVLSRIGWLSILCYTVLCRTVFMTINLSGLCCIRYRVFPVRRLYCAYCTVGRELSLYLYVILCTV